MYDEKVGVVAHLDYAEIERRIMAAMEVYAIRGSVPTLCYFDSLGFYGTTTGRISCSAPIISFEMNQEDVLKRLTRALKLETLRISANLMSHPEPVLKEKPKKHFEKFNKRTRHGKW